MKLKNCIERMAPLPGPLPLGGGEGESPGTTNVALPLAQWNLLGAATETPAGSGQFQFTDPQAPNFTARFYLLRSP